MSNSAKEFEEFCILESLDVEQNDLKKIWNHLYPYKELEKTNDDLREASGIFFEEAKTLEVLLIEACENMGCECCSDEMDEFEPEYDNPCFSCEFLNKPEIKKLRGG